MPNSQMAVRTGTGETVNESKSALTRMMFGSDFSDVQNCNVISEFLKSESFRMPCANRGSNTVLLQKVNRDTMQFAMKASAAKVNGNWRDVYKDPVTDRGMRSKKGRLALIEPEPGNYKTIPKDELGSQKNILEIVYSNGKLIREFNFEEVRKNASR